MAQSREHKGGMSVGEAGHMGGEKVSRERGREFYEEMGHKGGERGGPRVRELVEEGKQSERKGR